MTICDNCELRKDCKQYKQGRNKMEEKKIQPEEANKILSNLVKSAFIDGFMAAVNLFADQYKQVQEQGVLNKISEGYVELWRKNMENPAGENANEVQNNN